MSPFLKDPIPDPTLLPFDGGVGVLSRDGDVRGYVATTLRDFVTPFSRQKQWWVWFVVVWNDGKHEYSQEDYPPWTYVTERVEGRFEWVGGRHVREGRFDFAWLSEPEAAEVIVRFGITREEF